MGQNHSIQLQILEKQLIEINKRKYEPTYDIYKRNSIQYCTKCDIMHINKIKIIHCYLCNLCHADYSTFCKKCKRCYNPLLDSDIILHKKVCKKVF
jgi:hypothetical protein